MKILIQNTYPEAPHLETELEIALNYLNEGNEVYFLSSIKQFKHCYFNPENKLYRKYLAASVFSSGLHVLREVAPKNSKIYELDYPSVNLSGDIYPQINSIKELKKVTFDNFDIGMGVACYFFYFKPHFLIKTTPCFMF